MANKTKEILEKTIESIKNDANEIKVTIEALHSSGVLTDDERDTLVTKLGKNDEQSRMDSWYLLMACLFASCWRK